MVDFETQIYTPANQRHVLRVCLRILRNPHDAEDVVQDVFMKAWKHLGDFRGESEIGNWLHSIARNAALSYRRANTPRVQILSLDAPLSHDGDVGVLADLIPAAVGASPEWCIFLRETMQAIDFLAPKYRKTLSLRVQGLSDQEIGAIVGTLSAVSIRNRLYRARQQLRERLKPPRRRKA